LIAFIVFLPTRSSLFYCIYSFFPNISNLTINNIDHRKNIAARFVPAPEITGEPTLVGKPYLFNSEITGEPILVGKPYLFKLEITGEPILVGEPYLFKLEITGEPILVGKSGLLALVNKKSRNQIVGLCLQ